MAESERAAASLAREAPAPAPAEWPPPSPPLPWTSATAGPSAGSRASHELDAEVRATRFRFKSESSSRRRRHHHRHHSHHSDGSRRHGDRDPDSRSTEHDDGHPSKGDDEEDRRHRRHHHRHHRHHHRRRRRRSRSKSPVAAGAREARGEVREEEDKAEDDPFAQGPLSPDAAFRESLFDAMADDEGAAYWEGVYGQPIHVYGREKTAAGGDGGGNGVEGEGGELERMTDEEYATYVRQKMWEKTHAGLLEERERRARAREREREEREREEAEAARIASEMDRSLRRGRERRQRRVWKERWERYADAWTRWNTDPDPDPDGLPWPTESGDRPAEVAAAAGETDGAAGGAAAAVKEFFVRGLGLEELGQDEFAARLRDERVRWHPDKVQRRLGAKAGQDVLRDVTAIFQVVDQLWNDTRSK